MVGRCLIVSESFYAFLSFYMDSFHTNASSSSGTCVMRNVSLLPLFEPVDYGLEEPVENVTY